MALIKRPRPTTRRKPRTLTKPAPPKAKALVKPFPKAFGRKLGDGTRLVPYNDRPVHPSFKRIDAPEHLHANLFYVADFDRNRIAHLLIEEPDGHIVGWSTCGRCHKYFTNCPCHGIKLHKYLIDWLPKSETEKRYGVQIDVDDAPAPKKRLSKSVNGSDQRKTLIKHQPLAKPRAVLTKRK